MSVVAVMAVGVRLLVMQRVQQRRERENRRIDERLKTPIAAYKTLGGSFTGQLAVDPRHLRELRQPACGMGGGGPAPSHHATSATDDETKPHEGLSFRAKSRNPGRE